MQQRQRWLLLFAVLLTVWGHFSYACETMDMSPQSVCCCEDGMASCDTATVSSSSGDGCDHDGPAASSGLCCDVDYQSTAEGAALTSLNADQPLTWLYTALVCWPYLDPLFTLSSTVSPPDPGWLLAQAESGRTVYLSTLRLRI